MEVLYDYQIFQQQKYGGISRYFIELCNYMGERNKVSLFKGYNYNEYKLGGKNKNIDVTSIKRNGFKYFKHFYNIPNYLNFRRKYLHSNVDVYHPTYYVDTGIDYKIMVVTVYDMIHEMYPENFRFIDRTAKNKKKLLDKADGIIAISKSTKKDIVNFLKIDEQKIRVIYLANSLRYEIESMPFVEKDYILYVGNRRGYKNWERFIHSFARSKYKNDIACVCFGGGEFSPNEMNLLKKYSLENNVINISGDDSVLANLYKYATAFIYPSEYEGFGLPPLEAMYYGTPVLAGNKSSIPEVVGDAGILFDPLNIEEITFQLDRVLSSKELRDHLMKKGVKREKEFSWARCAEETEKYYKSLL